MSVPIIKFVQFLGFKLTYLLNYWRFYDIDGAFFAFWRYFSLIEAKFRKSDNHRVLEM